VKEIPIRRVSPSKKEKRIFLLQRRIISFLAAPLVRPTPQRDILQKITAK
jgi:hypothetical protein